MKSVISKIIMAGAAAAAIAVPATAASASTGFAVQDNGGVLVTSQHVSVGETVAYHGKAATITYVRQDGRSYIFRIAPGIPDPSATLTFSLVG
jgi:hypothetical protein